MTEPAGASASTTRASLLDDMDRGASTAASVHLLRDDEHIAWSLLWREAHECSSWIEERWPGEGALAGVLEPTRGCLAVVLGCWLAGRTFASLPQRSRGMDDDEYRAHLHTLAALAEAAVIALPDSQAPPDVGPGIEVRSWASFGRRRPGSGTNGGRLIQFTSGSTDRPRGVVLGLDQIGASARSMAAAIDVSGDIFASWLPLSHDMGLIGMCLAPLATFSPDLGGSSQVWLSEPVRFVRDALSWLRLAERAGATVTAAPNFALDLVARRMRPSTPAFDLSRLRCLIVGSETVSAATLRRFQTALARSGFHPSSLCPAYGLAEATLAVTIARPGQPWSARPAPDDHRAVPGDAPELVALGAPIPGISMRLATSGDAGTGPGGEIEVSGPPVARRFLGRSATVTPDGWLRTGDTGLVMDGELYFLGRSADTLVIRGRNIDARALQQHLATVDGVRRGSCVVFAEGMHGYAVAFEAAGSPAAGELRQRCHAVADAAVRSVGATPDRVVVVPRGQLPKTASGKVQPQRLRDRLASGLTVALVEVTAGRRVAASATPAGPRAGADDDGSRP